MREFAAALRGYLQDTEVPPAISSADVPVAGPAPAAPARPTTGGESLVGQFFDKLAARRTVAWGQFAVPAAAAPSPTTEAAASRHLPRRPFNRRLAVAAAGAALVCLLGVAIVELVPKAKITAVPAPLLAETESAHTATVTTSQPADGEPVPSPNVTAREPERNSTAPPTPVGGKGNRLISILPAEQNPIPIPLPAASSPEERERARRKTYAGRIAEVQRLLEGKDAQGAEQVLARCPADLRGWEWYYCQWLCDLNLVPGKNLRGDRPAFISEDVVTINHSGGVQGLAFNPLSCRLATVNSFFTMYSDASTGKQLTKQAAGHDTDKRIRGVAFSPDGKKIATWSDDGTIRIRDAETMKLLLVYRKHSGYVYSMAFSPDGHRAVSGGKDMMVRVWSAENGGEILALRGHTDSIRSVAYSPGGRLIGSGSNDSSVKLWDPTTGQEVDTLGGLEHSIGRIAFSPDGKRIAAATYGETAAVMVWDLETRKTVLTLSGHVSDVGFSPDGKRIVTGVSEGQVKLWDSDTGELVFTIPGHNSVRWTSGWAFSADGQRLAVNDEGETIRVYHARPPAVGVQFANPAGAKSVSAPDSEKRDYLTTRAASIKLKRIPAGTFLMGSPEKDGVWHEKPQHSVQITKPFYLGMYEVTQAQFQAVMGRNPSSFSPTGQGRDRVTGLSTEQFPVDSASWLDAVRFCNTLSAREGLNPFYEIDGEKVRVPNWRGTGYRLPTEAEWEYACRAGTRTIYPFGNDVGRLDDYVWHAGNDGWEQWDASRFFDEVKDFGRYLEELGRRGCRTHPVGQKLPNAFGLYDMLGNAWEWCWDWYDPHYYKSQVAVDPRGPGNGSDRVIRGSCWVGRPVRNDLYPAQRGNQGPGAVNAAISFRIARTCPFRN